MPFSDKLLELNPWLLFVAVPMAVSFAWLRIRESRLRISRQSSERLYLSSQGDPLADQLAANVAFSITIDNRILHMARQRENPLGFLQTFKQGRAYLRYKNDDRLGYSGESKSNGNPQDKIPNLKLRGNVLFFVVLVCFGGGLLVAIPIGEAFVLPVVVRAAALALACVAFGFLPLTASLSVAMSAAHKLLHELDTRHPRRDTRRTPDTSAQPPGPSITPVASRKRFLRPHFRRMSAWRHSAMGLPAIAPATAPGSSITDATMTTLPARHDPVHPVRA